jgi:putative membrane protein
MLRFLKLFPLLLLAAVFAAFAIENRTAVSLSLFPLPYNVDMPVFLLAMLCFMFGAFLAGLVATMKFYRSKMQFLAMKRKVDALENEVGGLRAERNVIPALRGDLEPHATTTHGTLDPRARRG